MFNFPAFNSFCPILLIDKFKSTLTSQNKKILIIVSVALGLLAACYAAFSYCSSYFKAKELFNPIQDPDSIQDSDRIHNQDSDLGSLFVDQHEIDFSAEDEEEFLSQDNSQIKKATEGESLLTLDTLPLDIWQNIIFHSRQGIGSVCKSLKSVPSHPPITALLFEANLHRLSSFNQVLNAQIGGLIQNLTLIKPSQSNLQLVLKHCRNCESLDLINSNITDTGLKKLSQNLTHLTSLNLKNCQQITDQGLTHLKNLTSLQSLNLSGCKKITDQGFAHLKNLNSLQSLDLRHTKLTDQGLAHLKNLNSLQSLDLCSCDITDQGLAHLKDLTSLQSLNLSFCDITDQGLAHLKDLTSLQSLNLSFCNITNQGLAHLKNLNSLQSLDLRQTKLTDQGLAHLKDLTSLQSLNLSFCNITNQGCNQLRDFFRNRLHIIL